MIRLFVCSTFLDFQAERDALHGVFDEIRTAAAERGVDFRVVDLRRGISKEASRRHMTVDICLRELERCKKLGSPPNFLFLVGDRYGWQPVPTSIPAKPFEALRDYWARAGLARTRCRKLMKHWRLDENAVPPAYVLESVTRSTEKALAGALVVALADLPSLRKAIPDFGRSMTELELENGVFRDGSRHQNVLGFYRQLTGLPKCDRPAGFVDSDELSGEKTAVELLGDIRRRLDRALPKRVVSLESRWKKGVYTVDPRLCRQVRRSLNAALDRDVESARRTSIKRSEKAQHDAYARLRQQGFQGQKDALEQIEEYLGGDKPYPLVIHGPSGIGKSALLARASRDAIRIKNLVSVRRFVGATPASRRPEQLFADVIRELGWRPTDHTTDADLLRDAAWQLFPCLMRNSRRNRLAVFVDAIDELVGERRVDQWLPDHLGTNVRLVLSVRDGAEQNWMRNHLPKGAMLSLASLSEDDAMKIVTHQLEQRGRSLIPQQERSLRASLGSEVTPLRARLLAAEVANWRSFDRPGPAPRTLDGVVERFLNRLSGDLEHGPLLAWALGVLAASRDGLSEQEIVAALSAEARVRKKIQRLYGARRKGPQIPDVVWARLFAELEPYLSYLESDGARLLGLLHAAFRTVIEGRFLDDDHRRCLERFFEDRDPGPRRSRELPPLLASLREWPKFASFFLDAENLLEAIRCHGVQATIDDINLRESQGAGSRSLDREAREALQEVRNALRLSRPVLDEYPEQGALHMLGRLSDSSNTRLRPLLQRLDADPDYRSLRWVRSGLIRPHSRVENFIDAVGQRVDGVALSPDGGTCATLNDKGVLTVWDARRAKSSFTIPDRVRCFAAAWSTGELWTSDEKGNLSVWNLTDELKDEVHLRIRGKPVWRSAATNKGERNVVLGSLDGRIIVIDRKGRDLLEELPKLRSTPKYPAEIWTIAISRGGRYIAAGVLERPALFVWDRSRGGPAEELHDPQGDEDWVRAVTFGGSPERLFSGDVAGTIRVYNVARRSLTHVLMHRPGPIRALAFDAKRKLLYTGLERRLQTWDLESGRARAGLELHEGHLNGIALTADGRRALSGGDDGRIAFWNLGGRRRAPRQPEQQRNVTGIAMATDGKTVLTSSGFGSVFVWDALTGGRLQAIRCGDEETVVTVVATSLRGDWYAWNALNEPVRLKSFRPGVRGRSIETNTAYVESMAFSADGRLLAVVGDGDPAVYDVWTGDRVCELKEDEALVVATMPRGRRALLGCRDGRVTVFDLPTGDTVGRPLRVRGEVTALTPIGRGRRWLCATSECVALLDLDKRRTIRRSESGVEHVAAFPDGRRALVAGGPLSVVSLPSLATEASFSGDSGIVRCAVADRGRVLVGAEGAGRVHFLQWRPQRQVQPA